MNEIQQRIFDIFLEIQSICDRNNIRYFAIGGTCIGAVRHHGFIPWDDDLDIAIPIEDYDRFLTLARQELPEHLELYTCDTVRHYRYIFAKVIDDRTTFIEERDKPYSDAYKGIYVDIMPISGVPAAPNARRRFIREIKWNYSMNDVRRFPLKEFSPGSKTWFMWLFSLPFRPFLSRRFFSDRYLALLRKHPFDTAQNVGYVWSWRLEQLIFPQEWFAGRVMLPFETKYMACPENWNGYLTAQFGDYMQPPPQPEQEGHHYGIVRTDQSYREYQKRRSELW